MNAGEFAGLDEFDDLKKELGGETIEGAFGMATNDGFTGEEYFETNPNDTSYELEQTNNTNRDFLTGDEMINPDALPIDMRSPDATQLLDQDKLSLST